MIYLNYKVAESEHISMGTVISNKVYGEQADSTIRSAVTEIQRLNGLLSRFIADSDISRINRSAGICQERITDETYEVLSKAVAFSKYSNGLFDITVGPLVSLWAESRKQSALPDRDAIHHLLPLVNSNSILFNPSKKMVVLNMKGQTIDLGGIGKGYAADRIIEVYRKQGITSAYTNFGGNVATVGTKPDGSLWNIGIRHPRRNTTIIGVVSVADRSVVTSGDYQRYYTLGDGKWYHHILNPLTGYPAESGLISVTVIASSSLEADALSTSLFVAGLDMVKEMLRPFPAIEAILIDRNLNIYITRGLKDRFHAMNDIKVSILDI